MIDQPSGAPPAEQIGPRSVLMHSGAPPDHLGHVRPNALGSEKANEVRRQAIPYAVVVIAIAFLGLVAGSYLVFVNAFPARH